MSDTNALSEIDVRMVAVADIEENSWNPNAMQSETFELLVETVKAEGMNQPVLVREAESGYVVVDGAHRFRAAKMAGIKNIAVVVVPFTEEQAKVRTISYNQMRGQFVPIKLARMIADLQKSYSDAEIRRMTGIPEEDQINLSNLLVVPELKTDEVSVISADDTSRPIHVHLLMMPDEFGEWDAAMKKAMELVGPDVTPIIGEQVHSYDDAMRTTMKLAGVKLRNLALAMICRAFSKLDMEEKVELIAEAKNHVISNLKK